jgi:hypothetical protein
MLVALAVVLCADNECSHEESDDAVPSSSCSSPANGEEYSYSPESNDDYELDDEVGKRLNQLIPIRVSSAALDHHGLLFLLVGESERLQSCFMFFRNGGYYSK